DGFLQDLLNEVCQRIYRDKPDAVPIEIQDLCQGESFNCEWKLMETVVANLLQNAQRFARSKIIVELKTTSTEYYVTVEDDGPGIAQEDREGVFESFVRLYGDGQAQAGGFGLGLAIGKRVMTWHDGDAVFVEGSTGGARVRLH